MDLNSLASKPHHGKTGKLSETGGFPLQPEAEGWRGRHPPSAPREPALPDTCCPSSSVQRLPQASVRGHYSTFNDSSCVMTFNSWFREKKKNSVTGST